jgi:hypothetical protein
LIQILEVEVAEHKRVFGITSDDFDLFLQQELEYFKDLEGPNPATELKKQYMKFLRDLAHWQYVSCLHNSTTLLNWPQL